MKRFSGWVLFLIAVFGGTSAWAADASVWVTDYDQAIKLAAAEKKPLLIYFSGSDWCSECKRLTKEVFSQTEFLDYAKKNLVLLNLDFPQKREDRVTLSPRNVELAKQYKIYGYPTVIVLDAEAKELGEFGYRVGGVKRWVGLIDELIVKK